MLKAKIFRILDGNALIYSLLIYMDMISLLVQQFSQLCLQLTYVTSCGNSCDTRLTRMIEFKSMMSNSW